MWRSIFLPFIAIQIICTCSSSGVPDLPPPAAVANDPVPLAVTPIEIISETSKPEAQPASVDLIAQSSDAILTIVKPEDASNVAINLIDSPTPQKSKSPNPVPETSAAEKPANPLIILKKVKSDEVRKHESGQSNGNINIISAIPVNSHSHPQNSGSLVLPNKGGGLQGYTYAGTGTSGTLSASDKLNSQGFTWGEVGGSLTPHAGGGGGQYGLGLGAEVNAGPLSAAFGISGGASTGLGFGKPGKHGEHDHDHGHEEGHGGHGGHESSHSHQSSGTNVFGFLQSLPVPFSSVGTGGSGGPNRLQGIPAVVATSLETSPGADKQSEVDKPAAPSTGLFGLLTPFAPFSSSILSDDTSSEESEDNKQRPEPGLFGGLFPGSGGGGGGLAGFFEPLTSLTGTSGGTLTLSGGATLKPLSEYFSKKKPLCPESLEVCIQACKDIGQSGGVLTHKNKCHCSCKVPHKLGGSELCNNKFTLHCNKFCKTNHHSSFESGTCNSMTGGCECKAPLGKSCFPNHHGSSHHSSSHGSSSHGSSSHGSSSHESSSHESSSHESSSHGSAPAAAIVPAHAAPAASTHPVPASAPAHAAPAAAAPAAAAPAHSAPAASTHPVPAEAPAHPAPAAVPPKPATSPAAAHPVPAKPPASAPASGTVLPVSPIH